MWHAIGVAKHARAGDRGREPRAQAYLANTVVRAVGNVEALRFVYKRTK